LWAEVLSAKDIHKEMFPVYGGKCFCHVKQFTAGLRNLKVADDARPSHPVEIAAETTVLQVEELIFADRRIMIDSVATALGCCHGLAYSIMRDHLKFWNVCTRWVPRELKDGERMNQMDLSLQHVF
jgi:hypothetical protein